MTEKECAACEKNRKGVYATPFGADHHHARIAELERERDSMEVSRDLAEAEELKTRKERDSAIERVKVLEALLLLRMDGRPEWQARMEDAEQECDEARAALRDLVYQSEWFESCAEEGSDAWKAYAEARRVLDSKSAREQAEERRDAEGPPRTQTPDSASNRADPPKDMAAAERHAPPMKADQPPKREGP